MVRNGPCVHPGAVFVEVEGGAKKALDPDNPVQREALAKTLLTGGEDGDGAMRQERDPRSKTP